MTHPVLPLAFLFACSATRTTASDAARYEIEQRRWEARPLLVFAPDPADPRWEQQTGALDDTKAGLAERDMDDVRIAGDSGTANGDEMVADDVAALRARYDVETDDFAVILVGKDGGEKLRVTETIAIDEIFATIDAMPMRRREMQTG